MTYNPTPGASITLAAHAVMETLRDMPELPAVDLQFNAVKLKVTRDDTPEGIVARYHAEDARLSQIYWASKEGKDFIASEARRWNKIRNNFDALMDSLPSVCDMRNAASWCYAMSQVNDDRRLFEHRPRWHIEVFQKLHSLGGYSHDCTTERLGREANTTEEICRWFVGQAMDMLGNKMPIHPSCGDLWMNWLKRHAGEDGHADKR